MIAKCRSPSRTIAEHDTAPRRIAEHDTAPHGIAEYRVPRSFIAGHIFPGITARSGKEV